MKIIFLATIDIIGVLLILNSVKLESMQNKLAHSIARLGYANIAAIVFYNLFMFSEHVFWADFFYSLFFIAIDFILIYAVFYVDDYCCISKETVRKKSVVFVFLIVDIISLLVNPFTNHVFKCFRRIMSDKSEIWMTIISNVFYYYHYIATFIVGFVILGTLLYKAIVSPSCYKKKYFDLVVLISIICVSELINCTTVVFFAYTLIVYSIIILLASVLPFIVYINLGKEMNKIIMNDSREGFACFDLDGKCVSVNKSMRAIIDFEEGYVGVEDRISSFIGEYSLQLLNKDNVCTITTEKAIIPRTFEIHKIDIKDKYGEKIGWYYFVIDRTAKKKMQFDEDYNASHDRLTKLYNKNTFYSRVEETLINNSDKKYYLVCTNIKDFKIFNEIFGTEIGDNLLRKIALGMSMHRTDNRVYARLDADRFAVLIPENEFRESVIVEFLKGISDAFSTDAYRVNLCAGVYKIDDITVPVQLMCDRAKLAISSISDEYSICVAYFSDNMLSDSLNEKRYISEFNNAIKNEQFVIYLQPLVDRAGRMLGAEALVRWNSPTFGIVAPGTFISLFEKNGLIHELDEYVWDKACQILKSWELMGYTDRFISINISYKDFFYMDVEKVLIDIVEKYKVNVKNLRLELTETAMVNDLNFCNETISRLKNYGFIIEIDDFGSGYSSFGLFKDMQFVDVIKLDIEIIKECAESERAGKIIASIIQLAKELNTSVVAEGIETKDQLDVLCSLGCDVFQGYYFAKPMEENVFEETYLSED